MGPVGPERKLGPTGPAEHHWLAETGTVRQAVACWTPVHGGGYDSAFGSSYNCSKDPGPMGRRRGGPLDRIPRRDVADTAEPRHEAYGAQ